MTEDDHHHHRQNPPPTNPPTPPQPTKFPSQISNHFKPTSNNNNKHYPNPPEITNPDAATLREQWKFAIRQYSKWYSHAWGTAILAGLSFFALGWVIKGENPIPSFHSPQNDDVSDSKTTNSTDSANPNPRP
uniref:uncharacterized protein LOC122597855 n=1 Tax=Erigeron canadensis TaxID=72917 RepID=UPI001CB8B4BD|nr:uncharacterized protein LOC122597855 [Erigeron canadensis]